MKEKVLIFSFAILALGIAISSVLLARGKMIAISADGLTANATLATANATLAAANKEKFVGMGEMWRGLAVFAQSIPPVFAWAAVLVLAVGAAIAIVRFSFSMSRVHEERNKYLVTSGSVLEKKLLGRSVPVHSLPFPVAGQSGCPDTNDRGQIDNPDRPEEEPYISPIHARQRIVSFTGR